jgi:propionyl-CoA carboxylase beta chain
VPAGAIEDNLTDEDIELDTLIPDSPNQPYDMHEVITRILDDDEFSRCRPDTPQTSSSASPHRGAAR